MAVVPLVGSADDDEEEVPFDEASIFFELNDTDGDLGIHALIDGDAWDKLKIEDPNERPMLSIRVRGRLKRQGLTEIFFESAEPTFDELDPVDFFKRFPEGIYEIEGETLEGEELESEVFVSHVIPAAPAGVMVNDEEAAEDCDADLPSVSEPVVIRWDPVTGSHAELGKEGDVEVVHYEVVVEQEDLELTLHIELPADASSFEVPADFIGLGDEFKFEILVRAETGNQSAIESCFELE